MKQERIIHIELGAEAADVIGWMRSLPNRTINQTVNEILSSESRGKIRQIHNAELQILLVKKANVGVVESTTK